MMKKKNLAVAMAAVTVAMPASQVFAAVVDNTQTEEIKAMKEKALDLMNKKYTKDANLLNTAANSDTNVFNIELTTPGSAGADECKSFAEFERKFDNAYAKLEDGQSIKIGYKYAKNIGYNTLEDGQVVDFKLEKYTEQELEKLAVNLKADGSIDKNVAIQVGEVRATELSDDKNGLERYKEIKVGDVELAQAKDSSNVKQKSFDRPVVRQENDYYVNVDGNSIAEAKDGDTVKLRIEDRNIDGKIVKVPVVDLVRKGETTKTTLENVQIDGFYANTDTPAETPQIKMDVITKKGTQNETLNASDLYNVSEGRVTTEGNELARKINFYSELDATNQKFYGAEYRVDKSETAKDKEMTIKVFTKAEGSTNETKIAEIKVVRDDKDTKAEAYKAITNILNADYKETTRVAAGADRYETAAEVSRMTFTGQKLIDFKASKEKAIVLVTGAQDKLVDGLTATPLAASLNRTADDAALTTAVGAPVLLTGNDKLAKPVLDEMERLGAEKVYIVGGAISESVEKQLKDVYGKEVDRVSGDDRYDTSMEVADKIAEIRTDAKADKTDNVFIVGGKGEADALSAASIAAHKKAPILLTNKDKLSKDIKYFIETKTDLKTTADENKAYVVGGTSSVSTSAYNDILDVVKSNSQIERLSGDNRQDTNAKVAKEFFSNPKSDKVVVAKSDNNGMVDALGAGLYAGLNNAPVILATNNLTEDQEDYLNDNTQVTTAANHKVMVGNGISSAIAKFIKNLK